MKLKQALPREYLNLVNKRQHELEDEKQTVHKRHHFNRKAETTTATLAPPDARYSNDNIVLFKCSTCFT